MKKQMFYVDMENVASTEFALEYLTSALLRADDDHNCIFAIKAAYGKQTTGKKTLNEQLIDHNFTLIDIPKIPVAATYELTDTRMQVGCGRMISGVAS